MQIKHIISWFEIPAIDIQRAQLFYETIFGYTLIPISYPHEMRVFPADPMGITGAICCKHSFYRSSLSGILIYLNANPDIQAILDKVGTAKGEVLVPKTKISDQHGYIAIIKDSEGNRIGLQSLN